MVAKFQFIVISVIITAPSRVERSLNLFYSISRSILCIYIYKYKTMFLFLRTVPTN